MKRILLPSCIFGTLIMLSACQNMPIVGPIMANNPTKAQAIYTGETFDQDQMAIARIAKERAVHPEVRHFASRMYSHYASNLHRTMRYAHHKHMTLESSDASRNLQVLGSHEVAQLQASDRDHFDSMFINTVIRNDEGAIQYLDGAIRTETNPRLVAKLKDVRRHVGMCLDKARHLKQNLGL